METKWPQTGPSFNTWQRDLAAFISALEEAKHTGFWTGDFDLKYLTIRIDTRDNGFLLFVDGKGDEKVRIDPHRVIDAIAEHKARYGDTKPYEGMR